MFAAVLAIAPVAGIPPNRAEHIFPIPCAVSSVFERCFLLIIPSATTHDKSDSIPARSAIVSASGNISITFESPNAGILNVGKVLLTSYKSPIVLTFIPKPFTITIPAATAINDAGILS